MQKSTGLLTKISRLTLSTLAIVILLFISGQFLASSDSVQDHSLSLHDSQQGSLFNISIWNPILDSHLPGGVPERTTKDIEESEESEESEDNDDNHFHYSFAEKLSEQFCIFIEPCKQNFRTVKSLLAPRYILFHSWKHFLI